MTIPQLSLKGAIIAGLAALLVFLVANTYLSISLGPIHIEGWKPKAERIAKDLSTEEARHAVTRGSVDSLTAKIQELNQAANARAKQFQDLKDRARSEEERLSKAAQTSRLRAEKLQALMNQPGSTCRASSELLDALEGL